MISVREAIDAVLRDLPCLGGERIGLAQARGRVLADAVCATRAVPPFRNSAMDGYAVRATDVAAAAGAHAVTLRVLEVIGAGTVPQHAVGAGCASAIMTGAVMPDGADAVVRVEDTESTAEHVRVRAAVPIGANVRQPGEDIRAGDHVLSPGRALRPADIGLLASLGCATVTVRRKPVIAIVSTGDELVDVGEPLAPGQIVNSNAYALAAAVEEAGATPRIMRRVRDTAEETRAAFAEALGSDLVLSTGGVSMGSFDIVRATLAELGVVERFWKVAQRPGKPLAFGRRAETPVFGLPGNPVSALVCFYVYVLPALRGMVGLEQRHLPVVPAVVDDEVHSTDGLTDFLRCTLSGAPGAYHARVTGSQSSGVLRSMSLGTGLLIAPPAVTTIARGATVRVMKLVDEAAAEPPV